MKHKGSGGTRWWPQNNFSNEKKILFSVMKLQGKKVT